MCEGGDACVKKTAGMQGRRVRRLPLVPKLRLGTQFAQALLTSRYQA